MRQVARGFLKTRTGFVASALLQGGVPTRERLLGGLLVGCAQWLPQEFGGRIAAKKSELSLQVGVEG